MILNILPLKSNLKNCLYLLHSWRLSSGKHIVHADMLSHLVSMLCLRKKITVFVEPSEMPTVSVQNTNLLVVLAQLLDISLRQTFWHLTLLCATGYFWISFLVTQMPRVKCNCCCCVLRVLLLPMPPALCGLQRERKGSLGLWFCQERDGSC